MLDKLTKHLAYHEMDTNHLRYKLLFQHFTTPVLLP
jgi:hypothetical protein